MFNSTFYSFVVLTWWQEYVEEMGGIRTETQEQIVTLIKEELENGHPADKTILTKILIEYHKIEIMITIFFFDDCRHGTSVVHDPELRELVKHIAQLVNMTELEIQQLFELYEKNSNINFYNRHQKRSKEYVPPRKTININFSCSTVKIETPTDQELPYTYNPFTSTTNTSVCYTLSLYDCLLIDGFRLD